MDFDPKHASKAQQEAMSGLNGDSINRHVFVVLGYQTQYGLTKKVSKAVNALDFHYDGWLVVYRYTKPADPEAIMRHHLRYNGACRHGHYNRDLYVGEPSIDFKFIHPPDNRSPPKYEPINNRFCGLNTDWNVLLDDILPEQARHFSIEQENMYLIETTKHYYVINYEYS